MHHLGEDGIRIERLLLAEMFGDLRQQIGIAVAEAAEQVRARRTADMLQQHASVALHGIATRRATGGGPDERRHH